MIEDPDPTTSVGKKNKKKQKKREIEVVETGDDDEEDDKRVYSQLGKSQTASAWKRIRRISSDGGSKVSCFLTFPKTKTWTNLDRRGMKWRRS